MRHSTAVLTISDKGAAGLRTDTSGPAVCAIAEDHGMDVVHRAVLPDDRERIQAELIRCADQLQVSLVLTTGGTGFSPRDVTPEATRAVIQREAPGIPEAMRAESLRITPSGCLSRGIAGIRGGTLIVNLPGSEKAARENLLSVIDALPHGLEILASSGSADCAGGRHMPSMDRWLSEAKAAPAAPQCGMYLFHSGTVRQTARAQVRDGAGGAPAVSGMRFSYDQALVDAAVAETYRMQGIHHVRVWLNQGDLAVGDDIMLVLVGGDIRPHVVDALQALVERLKTRCVQETELY